MAMACVCVHESGGRRDGLGSKSISTEHGHVLGPLGQC